MKSPEIPPGKLKKDAIVEALCEIQFDSKQSQSLPELVVGKLVEFDSWKEFQQNRLPIAEFPSAVRFQEPTLKYQAVVQLNDQEGGRVAKIGPNSLSVHRLTPYPGWEVFKPELVEAIEFLFTTFDDFAASRIALRYVNLFTAKDHGVKDVLDLNYSVNLAGEILDIDQNLNYRLSLSENEEVQVRIATPKFVSGVGDEEFSVLADVDVYAVTNWSTNDLEQALTWLDDAHTYEKSEFFRLFTAEMYERLAKS